MSKIICSGCKETFADMPNKLEAQAYLNEVTLDNTLAYQDQQDPIHTCDVCGNQNFELETNQTFGLVCDNCSNKVPYFNQKLEIGSVCPECQGGIMEACLVEAPEVK